MANADNFDLLDQQGWRQGFTNIFRKESGEWWHTRRWWTQSLLWLLLVNGILAIGLWLIPVVDPEEAGGLVENLGIFMQVMSWWPMYGVIIITQGAIIREKQSGTAAWVLSAPVSRSGFILAKLIANAIGFFVTIIVIQGAVAYAQLSISEGTLLPLGPYLINLSLLSLYLLFYLTLTLMLGTIFDSRGPVQGIALGIAIFSMMGLGQFLSGFLPWLIFILPETIPSLITALINGESIPDIWPIPIIAVTLYILVFIVVAIRRFNREEF